MGGGSRFTFSITHALHVLAAKGDTSSRASLAALAPGAAREANNQTVSALWAHFYATGDTKCVSRVLDAAADYADYLDEFGSAPVTRVLERKGADTASNNTEDWQQDTDTVPPDLVDSPHDAMRFGASRFALVSLLWHARRHTAVAEAFAKDLQVTQDAAASGDPFGLFEPGGGGGQDQDDSQPIGLSRHARRRLDIAKAILPAMSAASEAAWVDGIGSGIWPKSYAALLPAGRQGGGG